MSSIGRTLATVVMVALSNWSCGSTAPDATPEVATIVVSPSSSTLALNAQLPLQAQVQDESGAIVPDAAVTWTVQDPRILRISAEGIVTALAVGTSKVAANSLGKSGLATITVNAPAGSSGGGNSGGGNQAAVIRRRQFGRRQFQRRQFRRPQFEQFSPGPVATAGHGAIENVKAVPIQLAATEGQQEEPVPNRLQWSAPTPMPRRCRSGVEWEEEGKVTIRLGRRERRKSGSCRSA
jgi:hypothetical protein